MKSAFFNRIAERDIDLLIIEEFRCNKGFSDLFLTKIGKHSNFKNCVAYHSLSSVDGESDITFVLSYPNGDRYGVLIEDKIDAETMPDQSLRYTTRGDKQISENLFDNYSVFLVAPERYIIQHRDDPNAAYRHTVSYEEIISFLEGLGDIRSNHKAMMFRFAISKQNHQNAFLENENITNYFKELRSYVAEKHPRLQMIGKEKPKGFRSGWASFKVNIQGAKIYYKNDRGCIDLQIRGYGERANELARTYANVLLPGMVVVKAGNSASFRTSNPDWIIDFNLPFAETIDTIEKVLMSVEIIYDFSSRFDVHEFE